MSEAIQTNNPEVVVALVEELLQRGGLELALANRQPDELEMLLSFVNWKLPDHRYQHVLTQLLRFVMDMYAGVLLSADPEIKAEPVLKNFNELHSAVTE